MKNWVVSGLSNPYCWRIRSICSTVAFLAGERGGRVAGHHPDQDEGQHQQPEEDRHDEQDAADQEPEHRLVQSAGRAPRFVMDGGGGGASELRIPCVTGRIRPRSTRARRPGSSHSGKARHQRRPHPRPRPAPDRGARSPARSGLESGGMRADGPRLTGTGAMALRGGEADPPAGVPRRRSPTSIREADGGGKTGCPLSPASRCGGTRRRRRPG